MARKVFTLLLAALFLYISAPLLVPVTMGGVLAAMCFPLLLRMEKAKIPHKLSSAALTIGITTLVLLPTSFLIFLGAKAGVQQLQVIKNAPKSNVSWIEAVMSSSRFDSLMTMLGRWVPVERDQVINTLQDLAGSVGLKLADLFGQVLTRLPLMVMGLMIIIVSIYFFLVDGRRWVQFLRQYSFFEPKETDQLLNGLTQVCRSVVLASVLSGAGQGFFFLMICWFTHVPNALLIGFCVFLASFVPIIGSAPITFGVTFYQFLLGNTPEGIALLISSMMVAGIDNVIRPWFLKGASNLHPLIAFLAALGGLQTIGFLGVFLGPIIASMFLAVAQIFLVRDRKSRVGLI